MNLDGKLRSENAPLTPSTSYDTRASLSDKAKLRHIVLAEVRVDHKHKSTVVNCTAAVYNKHMQSYPHSNWNRAINKYMNECEQQQPEPD